MTPISHAGAHERITLLQNVPNVVLDKTDKETLFPTHAFVFNFIVDGVLPESILPCEHVRSFAGHTALLLPHRTAAR